MATFWGVWCQEWESLLLPQAGSENHLDELVKEVLPSSVWGFAQTLGSCPWVIGSQHPTASYD